VTADGHPLTVGRRAIASVRSATRAAVLCAAVAILASPAALAQFVPTTRVVTQADVVANCGGGTCVCTVNGALDPLCPGTWLRNYDSADQPTPQTDSDTAIATGTYLPFYDSSVTSNLDLLGDAHFGTLKAFAQAHSDTTGAYADAGGLAIPGTVNAYAWVTFTDEVTVMAMIPGQVVSLAIARSLTSTDMVDVGGGGLSIDPCLANGHGRTELEASLSVTSLDGTGGGLSQYARDTQTCQTPQIIGLPTDTLVVNVPDGKTARFYEVLSVTAYARQDGGEGGLAHPNRVRSADALLDASNTAKLYVMVLTPGATYTSASGTTYEVPESGAQASAAAAILSLLATTRLRRRS